MITMVQEEVQRGSPMVEKIATNVIKPKEDAIVNYITKPYWCCDEHNIFSK